MCRWKINHEPAVFCPRPAVLATPCANARNSDPLTAVWLSLTKLTLLSFIQSRLIALIVKTMFVPFASLGQTPPQS